MLAHTPNQGTGGTMLRRIATLVGGLAARARGGRDHLRGRDAGKVAVGPRSRAPSWSGHEAVRVAGRRDARFERLRGPPRRPDDRTVVRNAGAGRRDRRRVRDRAPVRAEHRLAQERPRQRLGHHRPRRHHLPRRAPRSRAHVRRRTSLLGQRPTHPPPLPRRRLPPGPPSGARRSPDRLSALSGRGWARVDRRVAAPPGPLRGSPAGRCRARGG